MRRNSKSLCSCILLLHMARPSSSIYGDTRENKLRSTLSKIHSAGDGRHCRSGSNRRERSRFGVTQAMISLGVGDLSSLQDLIRLSRRAKFGERHERHERRERAAICNWWCGDNFWKHPRRLLSLVPDFELSIRWSYGRDRLLDESGPRIHWEFTPPTFSTCIL